MGMVGKLFAHASEASLGKADSPAAVIPAAQSTLGVDVSETVIAVDAPEPAEPWGLADLWTGVRVVAAGKAASVTLVGFPTDSELLRIGRELAPEGIVVEPLIRRGGGGIDIRIRRTL